MGKEKKDGAENGRDDDEGEDEDGGVRDDDRGELHEDSGLKGGRWWIKMRR